MGSINVLEPQVANLIAAGEVVERPASAIKELLENSIDAGAHRITVEIKGGGVALMRITDDGCGMSRDDALVCIKRHATSKIKDASDLDGIVTLGFRGEALAAISSVSRMRIMTRTKDSEIGVVIECDAGKIISAEDSGCPLGTTIIVEELFANVPARKKFLKRDVSETAAVSAVVEKIALSRPDVAIKFITDGNVRFATEGDGNLMNVMYSVLGRDFAKKTVKIHDMTDGIEVEGFVGTPENSRGNRNYENFFINGRYVKCQTASAALEQAFSSYIPSDRFPCCVISMKINPAFVDVNVHPQKMEVKFSNDKPVFNSVYCAVRNALTARISRPVMDSSFQPEPIKITGEGYKLYNSVIATKSQTDEEAMRVANERDVLNVTYEQITVGEADRSLPTVGLADTEKAIVIDDMPKSVAADKYTENHSHQSEMVKMSNIRQDAVFNEKETVVSRQVNNPLNDCLSETIPPAAEEQSGTVSEISKSDRVPLSWYRIAGVVFNCYIFVELEDKMLVIDKHAAHERILFERMKTNMSSEQSASQMLFLPIELHLTRQEFAAACEYKDELLSVGFDFFEGEDQNMISVLQHPSGLSEGQASEMFSELISRLADGTGNIEISRKLFYEKALYQASCKAAVKGGREDSPENIAWIAEQVLTDPAIKYCPHGRPVAFEMTEKQFEKRFERL